MTAMTDIHLSVLINDSLTRVTPSNNTTSMQSKISTDKEETYLYREYNINHD
jgi:hypothetical protein